MSSPAELSARFDHGLAAGDHDVDVEVAHRFDESGVVAELLTDGADHRASPGACRSTSGRQSVSTANGVSTTCDGGAQHVDGEPLVATTRRPRQRRSDFAAAWPGGRGPSCAVL